MRLRNILLFLCLPALIWNAPLACSSPSQKHPTFSPSDLLTFENLSYDKITAFIETIEYGDPSRCFNKAQTYEVLNFVTFLARNGIPSWDTESQAELERDIEWLFSDEDDDAWWKFSSYNSKAFSIVPAVAQSDHPVEIIQCQGWLSKKWDKTKTFVRKHKKPIIIATAVVVIATVVIVATGGAAVAPIAAAGAAGAAGASGSEGRPHVNKPGEVRFQEEELPSPSQPPPAPSIGAMKRDFEGPTLVEAIQHRSNIIKETLSEELPSEALNIPPSEEASFWQNASQKTKEVSSWLAHNTLQEATEWIGVSNESAYEYHEKIDEAFGTEYAAQYTPEALTQGPQIAKGMLPPPGGGLTTTAKRVAAIAGSTGVVTGTAAIGSALTKETLPNRYIDPKLPKDPETLLEDPSWKETSHPEAQERGHRTFENQNTGERLQYDEAKPGESGHKGRSHWHRPNPNATGSHNKYLDAEGNPVAKGSPDSHLYPPE